MFFKMQNCWFCGIFGFFRAEIKKSLSHFLASSCHFLMCFFDSVIEKSTKFVWFVKDKQFAGWQVLIKSDWSHLSICDESKDAHFNWHRKCSIDWLCVIKTWHNSRPLQNYQFNEKSSFWSANKQSPQNAPVWCCVAEVYCFSSASRDSRYWLMVCLFSYRERRKYQ